MTISKNQKTQTHTDPLEAARMVALKLETDARAARLDLERAIKLARGTRDIRTADEKPAAQTLAEKIEAVLRGPQAPIALADLARLAGESGGKVHAELRRMRAQKCPTRSTEDAPDARLVYNHGTDYDPRWAWVIGDQTPTAELSAAVEKMITARPYTFAELTAATGARRGRLSGVLVKFQREGRDITNENGTDRQYRWKMSPRRARRATAAK